MSGRMLLWGRTGPFVLTKALQFLEHLQALQFLEHLIDVLSILLRCTDFAGIQKAVVDQSSSKPPNSDHDPFFGASLALGSALDLLRGSTSDLVMLWNPLFNTDHNLIKKWFIIVPNGSSLRRLRDDDASEWQFFFFFLICNQLMWHPLFKLFPLSGLLQMPDDCGMVDVEFLGNFLCDCKRISFDDPLSWSLTTSDGWPLCSSSSRSWTITALYVH